MLSLRGQMVNLPIVFRLSNAMNYAYLSHPGRIIEGNCEAGFRERPENLKLGQELYDASRGEGLTGLKVVKGWGERAGLGRWFRWWDLRICRSRISRIEACALECL
jgi:hypothetical protein